MMSLYHVVSGITHNFEDLITTHLHSKIEKEKCMELFVIDGDAEKVTTMTKDFHKIKYGYSKTSCTLK
jgi:NikR C terminal nickel binding domain.